MKALVNLPNASLLSGIRPSAFLCLRRASITTATKPSAPLLMMSSPKRRRTVPTTPVAAVATTSNRPSSPVQNKKNKMKATFSHKQSHKNVGLTCEALRDQILASADENSNDLECETFPLNPDHSSWILLVKQWLPCPDEDTFDQEWNLHPPDRHMLKLFGRTVAEKRWSASWGVSYAYSGATNPARPIPPKSRVAQLLDTVNDWVVAAAASDASTQSSSKERPYNACLQNWYEPDDTIGRHSDDERALRVDLPIFSLSWGGTRRFIVRGKDNPGKNKQEFFLQNGDLLVMGGTTQQTHTHEIPKRRVTMDPPTARRINWTLRAFNSDKNKKKNGNQETAQASSNKSI